MKQLVPKLIGRTGNCMFIYAHARALAEQQCLDFRCEPWIGEKIFDLNDQRPDGTPYGIVDGYCQNQASLIYTRKDCKRWFKLRPEIEQALSALPSYRCVAHLRRGDYKDLGYPMVSLSSYLEKADELKVLPMVCVTEEQPIRIGSFASGELSFMPDFWAMMKCRVLLRANSSFSWWAATLSDAEVYSPVIDGLPGGEHKTHFVAGNWPKLSDLPNMSDLHLAET